MKRMSINLSLFAMFLGVLIFSISIIMLVNRRLNESNSILWLLFGVMSLLVGCFPDILTLMAGWLKIDYPPALLFLLAIVIMMLMVFKQSTDISEMQTKINELATLLSIMSEENMQYKEELKREKE